MTKKNLYIAAGVVAFLVLALGTALVLGRGNDSSNSDSSKKTTAESTKKKEKTTPKKTAKSPTKASDSKAKADDDKKSEGSGSGQNAVTPTAAPTPTPEVLDPSANEPPLETYHWHSEPRHSEQPSFANSGLAAYIAKQTKLDVRDAIVDTKKSNVYVSYYVKDFKNDDDKVLNLTKNTALIKPFALSPGIGSFTVSLLAPDPSSKDAKNPDLKSCMSIEIGKEAAKAIDWKTVNNDKTALIRSASYFYIDPKIFEKLKDTAIKQAILEQQQKAKQ